MSFGAAWPSIPLGELCDISIGRTPSRDRPEYWGPGLPWLSIADMNQGRDIRWTKETITERAVRECKCRLVAPGTVLLSFKLSIGKVGIAQVPLFTNEAIAALPLRNSRKASSAFLTWALRSIDLTVGQDRAAKGLTLNKDKLGGLLIPVPPLPEQRRITEILDCADGLRANRRRTLECMDVFVRALFFELFGDPVTNPSGWPTLCLGDLIVDGPQNGLYKPASDYGEGTPIVRIDAFYRGQVTDLCSLRRVRVTEGECKAYGLREGDIIINRVNSPDYLGKSALVPALSEPTIFESNMMRFAVDRIRVCPRYLVEFLQTPFLKAQIRGRAKDAVNQSSINQQDVKSFLVRLPPLDLQREFASRAAAVERLKSASRASLARLDELFASLQHRAFVTGDL